MRSATRTRSGCTPSDARRIGVKSDDLIKVETEIGYFVDKVWVTEGIKPGVIAMSHHLGRWRLQENTGVNQISSALVEMDEERRTVNLKSGKFTAPGPVESADPDTSRIWWEDVGVHQNITHAVHPDPVSGDALLAPEGDQREQGRPRRKARRGVGRYQPLDGRLPEWVGLTRSAMDVSPDGLRRPLWLKRPLKPVVEAYKLPEKPFGRG